MLHIAVQVKELVSSNLNTLVETATNPVKMLRLLRHELQEYVVALQGDCTRAERRGERLAEEAATFDRAAADWTEKAQTAMTHKREDLARAALLTREQAIVDAARARSDAATAGAEADEIARTIADLEAKLAETNARLAEEVALATSGPATPPAARATRSERMLDRVATLEKRIDFATDRGAKPAAAKPDAAAVEAEIEQLQREARVSEELAAMKAVAKPAAVRKAKAKR